MKARIHTMKHLVIIVGVLAVSSHVLADWNHPHYSFRCLESEGIDIFGIHKDSTVKILSTKCENMPITPQDGVYNIWYNCTDEKTQETPTAYEVDISVHDPIFDGITTTTSTTPSAPIVTPVFSGGHNEHKFKIRCLSISDTGIDKTVAHVFRGGPHELPDNQKEVFPVKMHFKATKNIDVPDISEIYIGDEFYMFLEYTGVSQYQVIPKSCTAYAGTVAVAPGDSNTNVTLWGKKKDVTGCTEHKELLDSIEPYEKSNKIIAAKMYGFKFEGSEYITITCEVGVFPETPNKDICSSTRRRRDTRLGRRDAVDTAVLRKNVHGKLRVVDYPSEYKNMASKTGGSFIWIKLSLGVMMLSSLFSTFE